MPATLEEGIVRRRSSTLHGEATAEKFPYPQEVVVNAEKKCVNLAWYACRFEKNASSDGSKNLDYYLATYCVVKELWRLPINKWKHLFDMKEEDKKKDEEILSVLNHMRQTYLVIYPNLTKKNWSNTVLQYIIKMLSNLKTRKVTMLLLIKLLGLHQIVVNTAQAFEILGNVTIEINSEFSGEEHARWGLELPPEFLSNYGGEGWDLENIRWIGDKDVLLGPGILEQSKNLEERADQKSCVYWRAQIANMEKDKVKLLDALDSRNKAVQEIEEKLDNLKTELSEAAAMENLARKKDGLLPTDGTLEEKMEKVAMLSQLKQLAEDNKMSNEEAAAVFLEIREEIKNKAMGSMNKTPAASEKAKKGSKSLQATEGGKTDTERPQSSKDSSKKRKKRKAAEMESGDSIGKRQKPVNEEGNGADGSIGGVVEGQVKNVAEVVLSQDKNADDQHLPGQSQVIPMDVVSIGEEETKEKENACPDQQESNAERVTDSSENQMQDIQNGPIPEPVVGDHESAETLN